MALAIAAGCGTIIFAITQNSSTNNPSCAGVQGTNHQVMIMDDKPDNDNIKGKLCDTITFMNMDNVAREIAFGPHENHVPYDGVAEKVLNKDQSFTITLNQAGSFHWHDHIHDEVEGFFTVSK